jgi:predicted ATP-dependent endonuclease of OLD family
MTVPGDELGLGIQSAMVVGIFEAFRQLGGDFGTIVIEEPEMYLHPQAQRYFYRLLCEMVDNGQCQVIYSTHSPIFADVNRFETLRVVRRSEGKTTVNFVSENDAKQLLQARERFKLGSRFDATRNEVVFASKALLTEGYGDRIAVFLIAEKLGCDLDAEGAVVVDCGGKAGIELMVRVCRALRIPFVVLHDADIWPTENISDPEKREKQEQENKAEEEKNRRIKDAVGNDGTLYVITPSLEGVLGIPRDVSDKPKRIAEALKNLELDNPKPELDPVIEAVKALCYPDDSTARAGPGTGKEG